MVADGESAVLATRLIGDTCAKQEIQPGQLIIHADNGSSMKSNPAPFLMRIWASPGPIADRTSPTITRTQRATSKP
jgi:hypothetical protein